MKGAAKALAAAGIGAAVTRIALCALRERPPGGDERWRRINYAGRPVTRLAGPAYTVGAVAAAVLAPGPRRMRAAVALAVATAGAVGVYDDLAGDEDTRGLTGHLGALGRGEVSTGAVKILGLGLAGTASSALVRRDLVDVIPAALTIAGTANLVNLLDLRPGRGLKSGLVLGLVALRGPAAGPTAGALGAAVAVMPDDLAERVMLGDGGASALGAALGVGLAAGASRHGLRRIAAALLAAIVASEVVSYSKVIAAVPPLRAFDEWGRR